MKRVLVLAVVALLGLTAYGVYRVRLARTPIEWSGTVEARTMDVGSRVGGRVQEVLAREGARVDAGQPLLLLEPGDLPAQKLQAQGQLEQAQAALDRVANHRLPTARRAEIAASRARLESERVQLEKARLDAARFDRLFAAGAATRADYDNAQIAVRNTSAQVDAQQAQLDQLLQGTPQDVKAAQGQVEVAQGRLEQIDVALSELSVRAPRAAQVESLDLRPGDIVAPNATAAKLLEPDELYVRIYIPETELGYVHLGQKVSVYVDSFPKQAFDGEVEFIASQGEYSPRNLQTSDERADQVFSTRVRLRGGPGVLRAGMAAFARVPR